MQHDASLFMDCLILIQLIVGWEFDDSYILLSLRQYNRSKKSLTQIHGMDFFRSRIVNASFKPGRSWCSLLVDSQDVIVMLFKVRVHVFPFPHC